MTSSDKVSEGACFSFTFKTQGDTQDTDLLTEKNCVKKKKKKTQIEKGKMWMNTGTTFTRF